MISQAALREPGLGCSDRVAVGVELELIRGATDCRKRTSGPRVSWIPPDLGINRQPRASSIPGGP